MGFQCFLLFEPLNISDLLRDYTFIPSTMEIPILLSEVMTYRGNPNKKSFYELFEFRLIPFQGKN